MFSNRTVIIDCGASRTVLGVFSGTAGRLQLEEWAVEALPATAGGADSWLDHTRAALTSLGNQRKHGCPVTLVLPPHLVLTKFIQTPRVAPGKRAKVIRFAAEQGIPYALNDVVWDSVATSEDDAGCDVLLAAAKLEVVEGLCAAAQQAGFEVRQVLPSALASLGAFRLVHNQREEPGLMLNLGARSTSLLYLKGDRVLARTLAFGADRIAGQAAGGGAERAATRLAQEIARTMMHLRRSNELGDPAAVYLTGRGARLAGLAEALAGKLKVPVETFDVLPAFGLGSDATPVDAVEHAMLLVDAVGAATTQLRAGLPVLNLLPPARRRAAAVRRSRPWLVAAVVLALAAPLPPLLHLRSVAREARLRTEIIEGGMAPWREREARNRANLQQLAEVGQQIAFLGEIRHRRTAWLEFFADLQDRLGQVEDVWLERVAVISNPGEPLKLAVSGRMLDRANPLSKVSPGTFHRVTGLLAGLADSPFVAGIEAERFDHEQPGILKFDCVVIADPARPL